MWQGSVGVHDCGGTLRKKSKRAAPPAVLRPASGVQRWTATGALARPGGAGRVLAGAGSCVRVKAIGPLFYAKNGPLKEPLLSVHYVMYGV
jgi:hypothetical protein